MASKYFLPPISRTLADTSVSNNNEVFYLIWNKDLSGQILGRAHIWIRKFLLLDMELRVLQKKKKVETLLLDTTLENSLWEFSKQQAALMHSPVLPMRPHCGRRIPCIAYRVIFQVECHACGRLLHAACSDVRPGESNCNYFCRSCVAMIGVQGVWGRPLFQATATRARTSMAIIFWLSSMLTSSLVATWRAHSALCCWPTHNHSWSSNFLLKTFVCVEQQPAGIMSISKNRLFWSRLRSRMVIASHVSERYWL